MKSLIVWKRTLKVLTLVFIIIPTIIVSRGVFAKECNTFPSSISVLFQELVNKETFWEGVQCDLSPWKWGKIEAYVSNSDTLIATGEFCKRYDAVSTGEARDCLDTMRPSPLSFGMSWEELKDQRPNKLNQIEPNKRTNFSFGVRRAYERRDSILSFNGVDFGIEDFSLSNRLKRRAFIEDEGIFRDLGPIDFQYAFFGPEFCLLSAKFGYIVYQGCGILQLGVSRVAMLDRDNRSLEKVAFSLGKKTYVRIGFGYPKRVSPSNRNLFGIEKFRVIFSYSNQNIENPFPVCNSPKCPSDVTILKKGVIFEFLTSI